MGWAKTSAILGGVVSVAANVAHSFLPPVHAPQGWHPEIGAVVSAVVWPVFLYLAVEVLANTPWPHGWSWHLLKWVGLTPVAGVAAFVSYRHLSGLLEHYGEDPIVTIVGPLAIDGLMIMSAGALIAGKRYAATLAGAHVAPAAAPPLPQAKTVITPAAHVATPPTVIAPVAPVPPAPQPVTSPAPIPTAVPTATSPNGAVAPRPIPKPTPPPRPSTDTPVTASGPGRSSSSTESGLLRRARHAAEGHRRDTGRAITREELATKLRVREGLAQQLLTALETSTNPNPVPAPAAAR